MPTRRECANALRVLSVDAIENAKSGHPGAPLGMAEMVESLWRHFFKHNPKDASWPDRDRFILSNGHASMLLYSLLHLTGYDLSMDEIRNFRQWQSLTPGHPERGRTPGVEMTTGPLGQGLASAVGMALAEAMLAARYNRPGFKIVDHYTWVCCGDGCLMEGVSHEACSLAGTWRLGKLIVLYDSNGVSIDGNIEPWFGENIGQRFTAYDWQVIGPINGHDSSELDKAIQDAKAEEVRPTLIICKTHIGYGSPKTDTSASHGAPLGQPAAEATKVFLEWNEEPFKIPQEIYEAWDATATGAAVEKEWKELFAQYESRYPELASEFKRRMAGELPARWPDIKKDILEKSCSSQAPEATRVSSKNCLEVLVPNMPDLVGGAADLSSSVGTSVKGSIPLNSANWEGNYLFYGVREFGMGAIMNGLALHGGFIPYAGTFLSFSDQAKNALRLSALMNLRVIWILTHDSIGVGEDGPTHQPVEQIPTLRLIPELIVWRPCDNVETAQAWIYALADKNHPSCLILSRQKLPQLDETRGQVEGAIRGGYILRDCEGQPDIIIMASGSEVQLAIGAMKQLSEKGYKCRVVSMPCAEVFSAQPEEWRNAVLPPNVRCRLAIEAASSDWWKQYTGLDGDVIGMDGFGASAPGDVLFKKFGFTVENVLERAEALLARRVNSDKNV